jgi:hypothetical protein
MATADEFEPSVTLRPAEFTLDEHRQLLAAIAQARSSGTTTWIKVAGAPIAAIVPRGIAEVGQRQWKAETREV